MVTRLHARGLRPEHEGAGEHLPSAQPQIVASVPIAPLCRPDLGRERAGARATADALELGLDKPPRPVDHLRAPPLTRRTLPPGSLWCLS
eukprot:10694501-Heterocapsa_arctica.AAC.1